MKQFFRGSPIVIFFYVVMAVFSSCCIAYKAQCDAENAEVAKLYSDSLDSTISISSEKYVLLIFIAISFLLFCNIYNVVRHWTKVKRSEIRARMLSGGSPVTVCIQLLLNYAVIIAFALALGIIVSGVFISFDFVALDVSFFLDEIIKIVVLCSAFAFVGAIVGGITICKTYINLIRR